MCPMMTNREEIDELVRLAVDRQNKGGGKYVYIFVSPSSRQGQYKVGHTANVNSRRSQLCNDLDCYDGQMVFVMKSPNFRQIESYMHWKYDAHREWIRERTLPIDGAIDRIKTWSPGWEQPVRVLRGNSVTEEKKHQEKYPLLLLGPTEQKKVLDEEVVAFGLKYDPRPLLAVQNPATLKYQLNGLGCRLDLGCILEMVLVVKQQRRNSPAFTDFVESAQPRVVQMCDESGIKLINLIAEYCDYYEPGYEPRPFIWNIKKFWDCAVKLSDDESNSQYPRHHAEGPITSFDICMRQYQISHTKRPDRRLRIYK